MTAADVRAAALTVADVMLTAPRTHPPDVTVRQVRAFFGDGHVHAALIVSPAASCHPAPLLWPRAAR
jgi:hypothetical protein